MCRLDCHLTRHDVYQQLEGVLMEAKGLHSSKLNFLCVRINTATVVRQPLRTSWLLIEALDPEP